MLFHFLLKSVYHKLYIFQFQIFDINWPSLLHNYKNINFNLMLILIKSSLQLHSTKPIIFHILLEKTTIVKMTLFKDDFQIFRYEKEYVI